jgi:hypothetical protein
LLFSDEFFWEVQMSQEPISRRSVLYTIPGVDDVIVRRDVPYGEGLVIGFYAMPRSKHAPAVVIAAGYPDPGFKKFVGCKFKEMGSTVSWARLFAASGFIAIAYENRDPVRDLAELFRSLRRDAASMGIDPSRIAVWASSGSGSLGLSTLMMGQVPVKCAALCTPYTLDLDGTDVAEASKKFGFVNACAGKSMNDLSPDVPLFIARAGADESPHLNPTLDRFVSAAVRRNLPITLVNHHTAPHAFDLFDDSEKTREIIRQILAFLQFHLDS